MTRCRTTVARKCEWCGAEFRVEPYQLRRGGTRGHYCSRECGYAARRARTWVEVACRQCGQAFQARHWNVEQGQSKFCSRACVAASLRVAREERSGASGARCTVCRKPILFKSYIGKCYECGCGRKRRPEMAERGDAWLRGLTSKNAQVAA